MKKIGIVILLLAAGAEFIWRGPVRFLQAEETDFVLCYVPARAWIQGLNPYSPDAFVAVSQEAIGKSPAATNIRTHSPFPLPTLVAMSPVALFPWSYARAMWTALLTLSVMLAIFALVEFSGLKAHAFLFAALTLALAPLQTGIAVGNLSILVVSLCVLAVWAVARERTNLAGILLGIACCLKPQLGAWFLLYYALRKQWRVLLIAMAVGVAIAVTGVLRLEVVGVHWLADFLRNGREFVSGTSTVDFTEADPIRFTMIDLQVLFYAIGESAVWARFGALVAGAALLVTWIWFGFRSKPPELLSLAALVTISMLPVYHRNYDAAVLIFPLCWLLSETRSRSRTRWAWLLLLPFLLPGPSLLQSLAARIPSAITHGWWWNTLVMPHQIWALLGLAGFLLWAMVQPSSGTPSNNSMSASSG